MIGRVLGEGGFGITYIGYDLNLDVKVAVKEFYPSDLVTRSNTVSTTVQPYSGERSEYFTKGRDRFVDEAKRLARFRVLPGIVMVNDFLAENGTAYIVMEYVEGQTLKEYVAQSGGKLPPGQVIEMLSPVFGSLAQIHESGIIHRDISPDNVMITSDGSVKLLDFGAAREFGEDGNKSLSVMLKHGYAPAEQYSTKGVQGAHTDVYALSATIYKAITGVTPDSSMDRVVEDMVVPPSGMGITMQGNQEAALMKGLAIRYQDRYKTVSEMYAALREKAPQTPPPAAPPAASPDKKKRNKIIGAAVAACVVLAVILALTIPGEEKRDSPDGDDAGIQSEDVPPANENPEEEPDDPQEAVIEEDLSGTVIAIGYNNEYGQLDVSDWEDIIAIAAGGAHTVGLKSDGTVVAAGSNSSYQCDVSSWEDIVAIAANGLHTIGVKSDGTVLAVGHKSSGSPEVTDWQDIVAVAAGVYHLVGLKSDGTVVAAGSHTNYGQNETSEWRDIVAIDAGSSITVGVKSDGTVVATGDNKEGQLDVSGWRDIIAVSVGFNHTVGLKSDGTVVVVGGSNYHGENNLSEWRDIVAVAAGYSNTMGLKADGTLVAAGSNALGNLDVSDWRNIKAVVLSGGSTIGLIGHANQTQGVLQ